MAGAFLDADKNSRLVSRYKRRAAAPFYLAVLANAQSPPPPQEESKAGVLDPIVEMRTMHSGFDG